MIIISTIASLEIVHADVKAPSIFGDHMVLQRDREVPVWGLADPGEEVTVTIDGECATTRADDTGHWSVKLPSLLESEHQVEMVVRGKNNLVFRDVLIGDVWLCSGQSNMEFGLNQADNAAEALSKADYPQIRFFKVGRSASLDPKDECRGHWVVCKPDSADLKAFSAVGYFFGKEIHERQMIPVGLIGAYWGGTPAQSWTSLHKLQSVPALKHYADDFILTKDNMAALMDEYESKVIPQWEKEVEQWESSDASNKPEPRRPTPPNADPNKATMLFNGMISPIIPFAIKGVIWYQGEANADMAEEYATLFPALINDWRERWHEGDFPFLFVQLASWGKGGPQWPVIRDSQLKALSLPNTGMAVALDAGDKYTIHPKNKMVVGDRLALAARHIAYGQDIVYSGPIFKSMQIDGNRVAVFFDHVGSGLTVGPVQGPTVNTRNIPPAQELHGFEIAGPDGKFIPAKAIIDGTTILVSNESISSPTAVRYAWKDWPDPVANLYNQEGLPASPFNSETR
ncbi:MAG: sialate O-acetylesterase [Verrucomicrobiota bacterium JB024]|nr:sialate O-acetylesterase [Verrucomicrobiota bacterium JB024]